MEPSKYRVQIGLCIQNDQIISKNPIELYSVDVDPEEDLRHLSTLLHDKVKISQVSTYEFYLYFFTRDKDGKNPVGKLTRKIKDVLKDQDNIYATYSKNLNAQWKNLTFHNPPCELCGTILTSKLGIYSICVWGNCKNYCSICYPKIKNLRTHECIKCGSPASLISPPENPKENPLEEFGKLIWSSTRERRIARCKNNCSEKSIILKECETCGLPLSKVQTCGACQIVMYCSSQCQKKDWSHHKHICQKKEK